MISSVVGDRRTIAGVLFIYLEKIHYLQHYLTWKQMYLCHCFDLSNKMNNSAETFIDQSETHSTRNRQEMHTSINEDLTSVPSRLAINLEPKTTQLAVWQYYLLLEVHRKKDFLYYSVGNISWIWVIVYETCKSNIPNSACILSVLNIESIHHFAINLPCSSF